MWPNKARPLLMDCKWLRQADDTASASIEKIDRGAECTMKKEVIESEVCRWITSAKQVDFEAWQNRNDHVHANLVPD